jgi:hypothetical protein
VLGDDGPPLCLAAGQVDVGRGGGLGLVEADLGVRVDRTERDDGSAVDGRFGRFR